MHYIIILNGTFLFLIGVHCFCRGEFHDYQFAERDLFGSWAQEAYLPSSKYKPLVQENNSKWHRWLWCMLVSLSGAMAAVVWNVHFGQSMRSALGIMFIGLAEYALLIDPLISVLALKKGLLYISDTDKRNYRLFRIIKTNNPGLISLIARAALLLTTITIKFILLN